MALQAPPSEPEAARLITELKREFPAFKIVEKRGHRLSRWIDVALKLLTLGKQDRYLTEYHTVIGYTLYVPDSWADCPDLDRAILLCHERIHLRQRRRLTLPAMTFLYFIPFFPLGLAYGRARIEWEAYTETLRATAELKGIEAARAPELREKILSRFTGPDYGWMWPFPASLNRWYDEALREIEDERRRAGPNP